MISDGNSKNRLDTLAWLLEGGLSCTAVVVIESRMYITANEFKKGTSNDKNHVKLIDSIMNHLKKLATDAVFDNMNRNRLVEEIFLARFQRQVKGGVYVDRKEVQDLILKISNGEDIDDNSEGSQFIQVQGKVIYNRLRKMENAIVKNKLPKELLAAIRYYNIDCIVRYANTSNDQHVHAEVQVVDMVIDMVSQGRLHNGMIYIGISKVCCYMCGCFLMAANVVLSYKGIVIEHNDCNFANFKKWVLPLNGYENNDDNESNELKMRLRSEFDRFVLLNRNRMVKKNFNMYPEPSLSTYSNNEEEGLKNYIKRIRNELEAIGK
jgi:hypothetical protein